MEVPQHLNQLLQIMADISPEGGWNQVVNDWNRWRQAHPDIKPDLSRISFSFSEATDTSTRLVQDAKFPLIDFVQTDAELVPFLFMTLNLRLDTTKKFPKNLFKNVDLSGINLSGADLRECDFGRVNLSGADLSFSNLYRASFYHANLASANLTSANLEKADLGRTNLIEANFERANLTECFVYGVSAWDITLQNTIQSDLIITRPWQSKITVDNLEVAQLIYLLLDNKKVRDMLDMITSKVVLILGRFTPEKKAVLDIIRGELRKHNYTPVLFDFEKPASRDLTETVSILAHLARFIIVDLTDPSSAPHEVASVIPHTVVPVQPLLSRERFIVNGKEEERREYAMFEDLRRRHHWVLPTFCYQDTDELLASLQSQIIAPAEQKAKELTQPK